MKKIKTGIKRKKDKIHLFKFDDEFDITFKESGMAHINFFGNRQVLVDGCRSVVEYTDEVVCLNLGKSVLKINGENIKITSYNDLEILINGKFISVEFCE